MDALSTKRGDPLRKQSKEVPNKSHEMLPAVVDNEVAGRKESLTANFRKIGRTDSYINKTISNRT